MGYICTECSETHLAGDGEGCEAAAPTTRTEATLRDEIIAVLESYESGAFHPHPDANDEDAWPNVADRILALALKRVESVPWRQYEGRPRPLLGDVKAALR